MLSTSTTHMGDPLVKIDWRITDPHSLRPAFGPERRSKDYHYDALKQEVGYLK